MSQVPEMSGRDAENSGHLSAKDEDPGSELRELKEIEEEEDNLTQNPLPPDGKDEYGDGHGDESGDGHKAALGEKQHEKHDTVRHPDSTKESKRAGVDEQPDLKQNTGQGDTRATIPKDHSMMDIEARPPLTRTKGEVASTTLEGIGEKQPAEGNLSQGPTQTADDRVDGPNIVQEEEQGNKDEDQKKRQPRTTQYWLLLAGVLVGVAILLAAIYPPQPSPVTTAPWQVEDFLREMTALEARFHGQRPELWTRSRIHLKRHLQTARPTEPVSLILAAGRGAEKTLYCLAQGLASAFSTAHNASGVLLINGADAAGQDSDQVKLDIDRKLSGAFGGGEKPAAIVHRFEELPPSSTLIFYRYCDHENAAYKRTFLLFTVLLEEPEVAAEAPLNAVEELVDDQLQRKFLSHGGSVAFDTMDRDKYSGLWSRISHLILPVACQPLVERDGCRKD
ncbi:hypothetical protein CRUP_020415 [Coryphaenoides rupestris]|nr:hypothetical protein CRUP_020415 [Coryphaenoides rupestris]